MPKSLPLFHGLIKDFLAQHSYYAPMGIALRDAVKAYSIYRETDYHGNHDNDEGFNYEREDRMAREMNGYDRRIGEHYLVWSTLASTIDDHFKSLLRGEIA
jgi:hypothetical protein